MELCLSDPPSSPSNSVSLSHMSVRQRLVHLKLETHSLCVCVFWAGSLKRMLTESLVIVVIQSGAVVKMDKQLNCSLLISKDTAGAKFGENTVKVWLNAKQTGGGAEEEGEERGR